MTENGKGDGLPKASLAESARFVAQGLLPNVVRGLFSPRPRAMKLLTRLDTDRRAVELLAGLRRKHGGQGVRLLGGRIVTLWGDDALHEVLDQSADTYDSGGGAKGKGMAHFQPDALTVSHGDEWRDRRAFADYVLATKERVHPNAARYLAAIADEVGKLDAHDGSIDWQRFEQLFDHITLRVVFGDDARDDHELTEALEDLMGEANRLVGLSQGDDFHEFYAMLERRLRDPAPGSLIARFAEAPQTDNTRVVHQIPHMLFAMRDTLGANVYRALAAIVADDGIERRAREEVEGQNLVDPNTIDGMTYLEGCFQEAMRLWPTVPMIAREAKRDTEIAGTAVEEGTQVMILNAFNHRDPDEVPDADRIKPERWQGQNGSYKFNHLSNGTQYCPGGNLVLLMGKAVLAGMLDRFDLELRDPKLDPSGALPYMLDFFEIRFKADERKAAAVTT